MTRKDDEEIAIFGAANSLFFLKQADDGVGIDEVCRKVGISQQTYYRWRKKYTGLIPSELRRLKQLEDENNRLKRMGLVWIVPPWPTGLVNPPRFLSLWRRPLGTMFRRDRPSLPMARR
jgi:putative transposase